MLFVLLLAVPALPLPTGGVTHVFELIAMLLALELIVGRRTVWLPERWRQRELGRCRRRSASPRRSCGGSAGWSATPARACGFLLCAPLQRRGLRGGVLVLAVTAFVAPPFTGLDTVPSLGVVLISLGVLLEDSLLAALIGVAGRCGRRPSCSCCDPRQGSPVKRVRSSLLLRRRDGTRTYRS